MKNCRRRRSGTDRFRRYRCGIDARQNQVLLYQKSSMCITLARGNANGGGSWGFAPPDTIHMRVACAVRVHHSGMRTVAKEAGSSAIRKPESYCCFRHAGAMQVSDLNREPFRALRIHCNTGTIRTDDPQLEVCSFGLFIGCEGNGSLRPNGLNNQ